MKKFFCFVLAVTALIFTSCMSSRHMSINRIRHSEPVLPEIPFGAYTVLERVSGEATVSNVKTADGLFAGDTGSYGSLDTFDAIYLNIGEKTAINPKTPYDAALANAVYKMIERADALKADAVIFVRSKTKVSNENGKHTVFVEVSGAAIKLK